MGVAIPQVIAEDRASGAQIIDGSLKFDNIKFQHLTKTFSNEGNRQSWTWSGWVKQSSLSQSRQVLFGASGGNNDTDLLEFGFDTNGLYATVYTSATLTTTRFRDPSAWMHYFVKYDGTEIKWFVNGVEAHTWSQYSGNLGINGIWIHDIGKGTATGARHFDGSLSNVYFIDGHALGPEYFGFTDPLTNTWRPKKLEFPKRSFTNPRWYSSATLYNSVADVVANATDRGNGGVTVTNEYCYLVFNDGGYAHNGGEVQSPDYPVWSDVPSFSGTTRVFYYDSNDADNWVNASSYSSAATEWNKWRYSNSATKPDFLAYRISPYMGIENGNMLVFCANASIDNPTLAGTLASITLPTFDTNSFHFQNAAVDTWYTGGNSFYLPFDGNSPVGEDKFNNGNDWTPVNFGGSNTIEKATGALPILNTISGGKIATVGVRTDATVAAGVGTCVLAVPMAGPMPGNYTDVSNQIDSRSSVKTVTADDNADFSTDTSVFYSGSFKFDGTSDKVSIVDHDELDGFGDFTIEMWWYCSTLNSGEYLLAKGNSYMPYMIYNSGLDVLEFFASSDGSPTTGWDIANGASFGSSIPMLNKWNHIAVTREGSTGRLFLNGVQTDTFTSSLPLMTSGDNVTVFADSTGGAAPIGYAQDLRIYNGVAKYTSDFIPASTNPDILPDTPSGVSGGSKLAKITDGAVSFGGTTSLDYLTIPWSSDFNLGTSEFTIEFFVNFQDDATTSTLLSWGTDIDNRFDIGCQSANQLRLLARSSGNTLIFGSTPIGPKKWYHVAVVGYSDIGGGSTAIALYVNGERRFIATGALDTYAMPTDTSGYGIEIGRRRYASSVTDYFGGFISNLRIVKGSAIYPYQMNITVPTESLTNVTNTKLLCCQSVDEQQNNFIRMFRSDNLYTTRADILSNATEIFGGETLTDEYWYIVPHGTEPIEGTSGPNMVFSTDAGWTTNSRFYWRDGLSWTQTAGGYGNQDYSTAGGAGTGFSYQNGDMGGTTYSIYPERSFLVGSQNTGSSPSTLSGNVPNVIKYYKFNGAVRPSSETDSNFNDGRTWSAASQTNFVSSSLPNAFNNDTSANSYAETTGTDQELIGSITFDPAIPISSITTFKVSAVANGSNSQNWGFNGGSMTARVCNGITDLSDLLPSSGNLTSFEVQKTGTGVAVINEIEINGDRLIDGYDGFPLVGNENQPATNFNPFNTDINTVRGQETNHCTLNPLSSNNTNIALSEGNLHFEKISTAGSWGSVYGTIGMTTGKWYWEAEVTDVVDENLDFGVTTPDITTGGWFNGSFSVNVTYAVLTSGSNGDHWGFAIDMDNRTVQMYKNGIEYQTSTGIPNTVETLFPCVASYGQYQTSPAGRARVNFGQKPFKFPPPDGFQPLNGANVRPETVIARPDQYVGVTTYSGNVSSGTGTQQIKVGTQPDLVWIKKRFSTNAQHRLVDSVRGPNEELYSDTDQDSGSNNGLNSFDSDGFTVWTSNAGYNELGQDYVAWCWKAGGDKNTFNVDDVGYANASDVNMNAGALNSTIYDQSATWSTNSTMTLASGAFDGTDVGSSGNANYSSSGEVLTSSSITINNKLEIYTNRTHTGTTDGTKITINGTDYYDKPLASTGWSEVVIPRETLPLTSTGNITITDTQGTSGLWSVRVDGKRLVDSNATPPNLPAISATGCSIGTKQGFSIVKYTGSGTDNDEVPHGLSQKPDLVIVKNIDRSSTEWRVWHSGFGDNRNLKLGSDGAQDKNYWGDGNVYGYTSSDTSIILSGPPSTTTAEDVNLSGDNYIMYSWHDVPGLQKFGTFVGVNDPDGPFIELGFRPAIIWVKRISGSGNNWVVQDSERQKYNPVSDYLLLNSSGNTASGLDTDFLSNGFKIRNTNGNMNASSTYIYCAWAESPAVNLYGGTSNAR